MFLTDKEYPGNQETCYANHGTNLDRNTTAQLVEWCLLWTRQFNTGAILRPVNWETSSRVSSYRQMIISS